MSVVRGKEGYWNCLLKTSQIQYRRICCCMLFHWIWRHQLDWDSLQSLYTAAILEHGGSQGPCVDLEDCEWNQSRHQSIKIAFKTIWFLYHYWMSLVFDVRSTSIDIEWCDMVMVKQSWDWIRHHGNTIMKITYYKPCALHTYNTVL